MREGARRVKRVTQSARSLGREERVMSASRWVRTDSVGERMLRSSKGKKVKNGTARIW